MKDSLRTGICFGLTSAVITTLGLMVGLHSGTHSRLVVLGGILTIAIADAFSDALGIHMSEESENTHTAKEIWGSTVATFLTKLLFAMTFAVPVLLLPLFTAISRKCRVGSVDSRCSELHYRPDTRGAAMAGGRRASSDRRRRDRDHPLGRALDCRAGGITEADRHELTVTDRSMLH